MTDRSAFADRHIGPDADDIATMLDVIGAPSLATLSDPPRGLKIKQRLDVAPSRSESEVYADIARMADLNDGARMVSFLGAGAYRHYRPPAAAWFATRSEFLTAYTPYQAEASQGSLQAIFEWQTYMCLLTGMDVSNASVYDGSTAMVEGVIMAAHAEGSKRIAISQAVHPLYRRTLQTYADGMGFEIVELPCGAGGRTALPEKLDGSFAALVMQSPNFFGCIEEVDRAARLAHDNGALLIHVATEALSLAVLKTPRELGADRLTQAGLVLGLEALERVAAKRDRLLAVAVPQVEVGEQQGEDRGEPPVAGDGGLGQLLAGERLRLGLAALHEPDPGLGLSLLHI